MSTRTVLIIVFYLLVAWYVIFVAGTIQYRLLKKKTAQIVQKYAGQVASLNPTDVPGQLYEALYVEWCEMVKSSAWFIPSKSELRPILATPENVKRRLGFSPKWVSDYLDGKHPERGTRIGD